MASSKTCFVIMPIRTEGSTDHSHFKALYDSVLKPTIAAAGYLVTRADEVSKAGSVTKDIMDRLASADLVVADMTDLNPNVFWELGVRHALRAHGTLTIIDERRTQEVPFDLSPYRTIRYAGELVGIARLQEKLLAFLEAQNHPMITPDSPVHDWLPALPPNLLATSTGSDEADLRERLAALVRTVQGYEREYGQLSTTKAPEGDRPLDVVATALEDIAAGNDPTDLLQQAETALANADKKAFLESTRRILERPAVDYDPSFFIELSRIANLFGLGKVAIAALEHACHGHPTHASLKRLRLSHLVHSLLPTERERGRLEILYEVGITLKDDRVELPTTLKSDKISQIGFMLDAYHRDGMHQQAVRITTAMIEAFPTNAVITRNHARALEYVDREDEALGWYQRALTQPGVDGTCMRWFGNELLSRDRNVDAVEVLALGCLRDPDDGGNFAALALGLAVVLNDQELPMPTDQRSPSEIITPALLTQVVLACVSCEMSQDTQEVLRAALKKYPLDDAPPSADDRMSLRERGELSMRVYAALKSPLSVGHPLDSGPERPA